MQSVGDFAVHEHGRRVGGGLEARRQRDGEAVEVAAARDDRARGHSHADRRDNRVVVELLHQLERDIHADRRRRRREHDRIADPLDE